MTDAATIIGAIEAAGAAVRIHRGRIQVNPPDTIDTDLRDRISECKDTLIDAIRRRDLERRLWSHRQHRDQCNRYAHQTRGNPASAKWSRDARRWRLIIEHVQRCDGTPAGIVAAELDAVARAMDNEAESESA